MTSSIRLPAEIEERLELLAEKTGRPKSYHAREAIVRYLEDLEDEQLALERLAKPERRWTLEELEQELDLES
jgi:RHH-type transcriptional regulator, rel operon repressor / antitoxin RelB